MKILYAFPEPLPLAKARGQQVAHTTRHLAGSTAIEAMTLAYVPVAGVAGQSPYEAYQLIKPDNVIEQPISRCWPWPFARWHSTRVFTQRLVRHIQQAAPELIYVRHLKLAAALLQQVPHIPLVYEAHEVFYDTVAEKKRPKTQALEQSVADQALGVMCNSRATAQRFQALYQAKRCDVLHNGVDHVPAWTEKNWAAASQSIIYTGSFFGWKGVADLVSAAQQLPPNFHMTLIGGSLEQLAIEGGIQPDLIQVLPHMTQSLVAEQLQQACIAVLPNRPDTDSQFTSPIKLFEYMAAGCAIVASDLPSVREVLDEDEAQWFTPGDAHSLAQALTTLASQPDRARIMAQKVQAKAKHYTWQARAERQVGLLQHWLRE